MVSLRKNLLTGLWRLNDGFSNIRSIADWVRHGFSQIHHFLSFITPSFAEVSTTSTVPTDHEEEEKRTRLSSVHPHLPSMRSFNQGIDIEHGATPLLRWG